MFYLLTIIFDNQEKNKYKIGDKVPIELLKDWFIQDSSSAYENAKIQAEHIGAENQDLVNALTAVNFQLGNAWYEKHTKTWGLLSAHKWKDAAKEAGNSVWFKQTPVRVLDFQKALLHLAGLPSDFESLRALNKDNINKWKPENFPSSFKGLKSVTEGLD